MFYSISDKYYCNIKGKITSFHKCWSFITYVHKSRTTPAGSNSFTYDIIIKMIKYINNDKSYTKLEKITLIALFCFLCESGCRGAEIYNICYKRNFKSYAPDTFTYLYNDSKTNPNCVMQCSIIKCICSGKRHIACGYHAMKQLFKNNTFEPDQCVFTYRSKPTDARLARNIQKYIFDNIGLDHSNYTLHGFRKGSAQTKIVRGMNILQLLMQHNWKSITSADPYLRNMDPALKTLFISKT